MVRMDLGRLGPSANKLMALARICCHLPPHFTFSRKIKNSRQDHSYFSLSSYSEKINRFSLSGSATYSVMASAAKKVLVPVAHGTEPIEAVVQIGILRRAGAEVTVASVEKELRVDALHGVKIIADALISDCVDTEFDLLSLPGGMPGAATLRDCETLESIFKKQAERKGLYAAICASPAVALGPWGLLKGFKATCYPTFMEQLSQSSAIAVESRVQVDGNVVTSRGPGTVMEYAVALVEQLYGKEKAFEDLGSLLMRSNHGDEYTFAEFNSVNWSVANNSPQVLVPIANGTEEVEALIIVDVLRRAKAQVTVASVEDTLEIIGSKKVKLVADSPLDAAAEKTPYDLIVLPGGLVGAETFAKSEKLVNMLKTQKESNKPYGAICASPALVLEPHGLLTGKKATAYPGLCNKLSDASEVENRVVVDGTLVTSRGPGTTMEFALVIVEKLLGRSKAVELAKGMVFVQ